MINPIDRDALRRRVVEAAPFPFFVVDGFLDAGSAARVHDAFPSFEEAARVGMSFDAVNERGKVQVTDASKFAGPVAELNRALAGPRSSWALLGPRLRHARICWPTTSSWAGGSTRPAPGATWTSTSTSTTSPSAGSTAG